MTRSTARCSTATPRQGAKQSGYRQAGARMFPSVARHGSMYLQEDPTMNDMPSPPSPDGKAIADLAEQLNQLLRLRTFPIGMKLFEDVAAMEAIPGLRRPAKGKTFSTCQLVTQSRMAGFTLGVTTENVPEFSNCSGVIGLSQPSELFL